MKFRQYWDCNVLYVRIRNTSRCRPRYKMMERQCSKASNTFTGYTEEVGALLGIVVKGEEEIWYQGSRIQQEWVGSGRAFMSEARHLASWRPWVVLVWAIGWPFISPSVGIGKGLSPREPRDVYSLEHTFAERTQLLGNLNGFRVGIDNSAIIIMNRYFDVWLQKKF